MDSATLMAIGPTLLLLGLGVLAAISSRILGTSPIVGYLLLGVSLNVAGLQSLTQSEIVASLASLGVMFLLFDLGLHFSLKEVRERAGDIFGFGAVQVLLGTAGLAGAAIAMGTAPGAALIVGGVLALSSTAVVAILIAERHQQNCPVGMTATAILIFQDVAAILLLVIVNALGSSALLPAIGLAIAKAIAAFAVTIMVARLVVKPLFDIVARTGTEEVFTATALFVALAAGWASGEIGLSLTLGAFLGGVTLAATPYRPTVAAEIKPFKGLLLGMFFISVGASLDLGILATHWGQVVIVTVGFLLVKTLTNIAASVIFRWSVPGSTQLGLLLAQGSEFAFVIMTLPAVRRLVGEEVASLVMTAVAVSLVLTPYLALAGRKAAAAMRGRIKARKEAEMQERLIPCVLVVGMGRRGRTVSDALRNFSIPYSAVDRDSKRVGEAVADGYDVMLANVGDPRLWEPVDARARRFSVLTAPTFAESRDLSHFAKTNHPHLRRVAAVANQEEADQFQAIGVEPIIDRSDPPGLDLAAFILQEMGVQKSAIAEWRKRQRSREIALPEELLATA